MKTDFSIPRRQNLRGILVVFFMDLFKSLRQNFYVLLPLLSSKVRENYLGTVVIVVIVLLILQLLYSYKSYLNFKFHVQNQRFFLKQGVFNSTDTDIPFDRIQNININQNLIQKVLNVVGLEIETAGQKAAEIKIKALTEEVAIELKEVLLKKSTGDQFIAEGFVENSDVLENDPSASPIPQKSKVLFKLDFIQLLKVGISSNYFKGFGLVLLIISTLFQYLQDVFKNLFDVDFDEMYLSQIQGTFAFILSLIVLLLAATFVVTVGRTVFKYFDLKVTKVDHEYEVEHGLLKRVIQVIKKNKAQVFEIEENPIKNLFNIRNVFISQASSQDLNNKKKIGVIGITDQNMKILFNSIFDLSYPQTFIKINSSMRLIIRMMVANIIISASIGIAVYYLQGLILSLIVSIFMMIILIFISFSKVKKSHVGVNEDLIEIQSGSIHTNRKYIAVHKIQSIAIERNVFQQRNEHADLVIYTASGKERINYLKYEEVLKVSNYLNFKVENSGLGWI
ncbi:PH domain-containing protein [Brumimicrobium mesophilum]|uniref:PH domain-containing protein n=1 Tax=Brumimicrobium mesophilum TaxID=392717 RepID=UPI000D142D7C|nr:PH domain-containing protein [Brumimicrobium mesophilum]